MDNVTHAALGVCAGLAARRAGAPVAPAALAALLAAEAPDLDILIRSANDPLVAFRWHRHFTHSFAFLPVFIVTAAFLAAWIFRGRHETSTRALLLPAAAGGLTHLLCDACTSYGTMLLWPFSDARIAFDCLPIVDVAVTLPLIVLAWRAWKTHSHIPAYAGVAWFGLYAGIGRIQHDRAEAALYAWSKDQPVSRLAAKPTISNLLLWRGVWLEGDIWHVAAVRIPPWGPAQVLEGESRLAWTPQTAGTPHAGTPNGEVLSDFSRFTGGWNSVEPTEDGALVVGDIRFAMVPDRAASLWSVRLQGDDGAEVTMNRAIREGDWSHFGALLLGTAEGYQPLR